MNRGGGGELSVLAKVSFLTSGRQVPPDAATTGEHVGGSGLKKEVSPCNLKKDPNWFERGVICGHLTASLCVCMCARACVCVCVHMGVYMRVCVHMGVYMRVCVHMGVYMRVCVHMGVYMRVCVFTGRTGTSAGVRRHDKAARGGPSSQQPE